MRWIARGTILATATLLLGCGGQAQVPPLFGTTTDSGGDILCTAFDAGNTVICDPSDGAFTEALGGELLAQMPDRKKPVVLRTVGGSLNQATGTDVERFLLNHGYEVRRSRIDTLSRVSDDPYTLNIGEAQYQLTVDPLEH